MLSFLHMNAEVPDSVPISCVPALKCTTLSHCVLQAESYDDTVHAVIQLQGPLIIIPTSTTVSTGQVQNTIQQGETKQATEPKWSELFCYCKETEPL
jgi:hypothetical protein